MVAIGIRYYNLRNAGIACIIWPQLRKDGNTGEVVWDGRKKDESKYRLYINSDVTVDLSTIGIPTDTKFVLSENTMWGTDMWDSSQAFFYDPNSNVTAGATKWGGIHDGQLTYGGCKLWKVESGEQKIDMPMAAEIEAYAAAVADQKIEELLNASFGDELDGAPDGRGPWKGIAKWAAKTNPNLILTGTGLILAFLIAKGYAVVKESVTLPDGTVVTTWFLGPTLRNGHGIVPEKVVQDWNAALDKAKGTKVINGGITDTK